METQNELIAEFICMTKGKPNESRWKDNWFDNDGIINGQRNEHLYFDTSWNWLMPVVEKIENLGFEFFIVENRVKIAHNSDNSIKVIIDFTFNGSKIDAVYQGVTEFIKYYN